MTFSQSAVNQATAARAEAQQQIENVRKIMMAARQQIADSIQQQVIEIKAEHAKQAASAATAAKTAAHQQTDNTATKAQAQLAALLMELARQTGATQEDTVQQVMEAAKTATEVSDQVSQLFQALSQPNPQHEETINSES
jgi:macrodomain Ter protein organizer (MatP/YcbG family)